MIEDIVDDYISNAKLTHRTCRQRAIIRKANPYNTIVLDYYCEICGWTVHSCNVMELDPEEHDLEVVKLSEVM